MNVDNVDVDMQRHEPEDAQTSHDADLFDEDDDDERGADNFMDALSQSPSQLLTDALPHTPPTQPPTDALRVRQEEHERHIHNVNENTRQWEAALKEWEKQEIQAWEEQAKKNAAEEMVWHEALAQREAELSTRKDKELAEELAQRKVELSTRKDKELAEELARCEEELSARKHNELEEHTLERRHLADELARHEAELSERKKQEVEEHEKVIAAEMEQRLHLEIEKLRAEKASELTNMEQ
ncbi:hypothetical protein BDR05DRAFT_1005983 [Suillus weaverae]|nr:hypothetical protein BDR05DRAFT_1005983 [Suillus weaverae]